MDKYQEIAMALQKNDPEFVHSLIGLLKHHNELKITYQINYIDLVEGRDDKFFFKLFILNNNKWEFFDYGWLYVNGTFYTNKSKILVFNISDIDQRIEKRIDSDKHIMIAGYGVTYLLYNIYPKIIDLLLSKMNYFNDLS